MIYLIQSNRKTKAPTIREEINQYYINAAVNCWLTTRQSSVAGLVMVLELRNSIRYVKYGYNTTTK